ncbi:SIR2 family NAD-dependent protein deacylase [Asanoa iriomotensis]|uniref:NAD-dependent protein deacylase n=1 Tax=Asanoa iriomotensis TaxID=234613 RepID=A0ABQ4C1E5_9ACTN|nr:NAD-dependent deacylase [Asanoa iriomotensis]GIF56574.1 NAD-dependent protein deacylase 1 [Asanoa iriomotensis]
MIDEAAAALGAAGRVVVFTCAGISAESGVPTFRDDLTGLWARYDPEQLATPEAFDTDPDLVWGWYEWRRARVRQASPNAGHVAVAAIEARVPGSVVVTQNVDDLHERAGSTAPIHLHGSLFAPRCAASAHPAELPESAAASDGGRIEPPRCTECDALVRPGVVWFGEPLPEAALSAAVDACGDCDVLLTVGTSGVVYPAAALPLIAARAGATVIQINPDRTPLDDVCTFNLRGTAAQLLPALVRSAF